MWANRVNRWRTLCSMPVASSPHWVSKRAGSPCSMKRSGRPRCRIGMLMPNSARTSATALPAPPATAFSSTVTRASWPSASCCDQFPVDWLHETHVGDGEVQLLANLDGRRHHAAEGKNGDAPTLPPQLALAHRERAQLAQRHHSRPNTARITHRRRDPGEIRCRASAGIHLRRTAPSRSCWAGNANRTGRSCRHGWGRRRPPARRGRWRRAPAGSAAPHRG